MYVYIHRPEIGQRVVVKVEGRISLPRLLVLVLAALAAEREPCRLDALHIRSDLVAARGSSDG